MLESHFKIIQSRAWIVVGNYTSNESHQFAFDRKFDWKPLSESARQQKKGSRASFISAAAKKKCNFSLIKKSKTQFHDGKYFILCWSWQLQRLEIEIRHSKRSEKTIYFHSMKEWIINLTNWYYRKIHQMRMQYFISVDFGATKN